MDRNTERRMEGNKQMADRNEIKEKIRKIYNVLPKLDDQRCGYRTCGEFARAVAEGKAPCYGCVSGGSEVAAKVCEIMGARVPEETASQFGPIPGPRQPGLTGGRGLGSGIGPGMGRGMGLGIGRGMGLGMGRGMGRGRGRSMGGGFGRGRHGR